MDSFVTVKDAAGILGVTAATLRNWDKSGRLKARRHPLNGYRIYQLKDVIALQKKITLWPMVETDLELPAPPRHELCRSDLRKLVRSLQRAIRDNDGSSSLIERFDELAKLIFVKLETERSASQVPAITFKADGSDAEVASSAKEAFARLVKSNPALFPSRFSQLSLREPAVAEVARCLSAVTLRHSGEDLKGLLFEEVVHDTFEKGENQQFFTPAPIVQFMVGFVSSLLHGNIADPACGTGGFLISVAAASKKGSVRDVRKKQVLWGLEVDARLAWATGLNLFLHDAGDFHVKALDNAGSLAPAVLEELPQMDLILTNPPFGSDLSDPASLQTFRLGVGRKSRRRGVLFLERSLDLLRPGGVLGIVIDDGVLNGPTNDDVRRHLLSEADLIAVISMPEVAFMPYATVKASIVFLQKRGGRQPRLLQEQGTFFAAAEQVGRKPSGEPLYRFNRISRRLELDSDLPEILDAWQRRSKDFAKGFWSQVPLSTNPAFAASMHRLDAPFHHPARTTAAQLLHSSPYPLVSLSDVCDLRSETMIPAQQCEDDELTYVGLASIEANTGAISPTVVPGSTLKSSVKRFLAGDILFAKMRPELRKVAIVPDDVVEGVCSAECLVLVPKSKGGTKILPTLVCHLLRSDLVYGQLVHQVMGIGRPRLRPADIMAVRIPLPPLSVQQQVMRDLENAEVAAGALLSQARNSVDNAGKIQAEAMERLARTFLGEKVPQ
jgi:type I restriction enzyme M protein